MLGLQTLLDPTTLIILGAFVLGLVLWGVFMARRRPSLRATVLDEPLPYPPPSMLNPEPYVTAPATPSPYAYTEPTLSGYQQTPPAAPPQPTVPSAPAAPPPVVASALQPSRGTALTASYNADSGTMSGPFPLPPQEMPLQDSRLVVPTEVIVLWRSVSRDVEEFTVRIDTVSHDQLVFGGLVHNNRAPQAENALERRLFHTMVLPDESMLSIRTRNGTPIKNVRAWLRSLPDAGEAYLT